MLSASQCCHWNVNDVGFPLQSPSSAVSVSPTSGVPETSGRPVFFGAALDVAAATTAVCADCAGVEPSALTAVTRTRIVDPASAATSVYVFCVAPAIAVQALPPPLQRSHWYWNEVGLFVQVPFSAVSVCPTVGVPEIV